MAIRDKEELLNCLDEFEESPVVRLKNMQVLRMKALRLGEIDEDEHKVVNAITRDDLALLRLGVEDKKATADSEIALILAEQMQKYRAPVDRTTGTGVQPEVEDLSAIEAIEVSEESTQLVDVVDIDKLKLDL